MSTGLSKTVAAAVEALMDSEETRGALPRSVATEGFLTAAQRGDIDGMRSGLEAGADMEAIGPSGRTAAMWAIARNSMEMWDFLIGAGVDPGGRGTGGSTALMMAAEWGRDVFAERLVQEGVDVEARNKQGRTATMLAARNGHGGCLGVLMESGVDVNAVDEYGCSALAMACEYRHGGEARALVDAQAKLDGVDIAGWTAAMWAAHEGSLAIVRMLFEHGADLSIASLTEGSALDLALANNRHEVASYIRHALEMREEEAMLAALVAEPGAPKAKPRARL